jgi:hypothetical protein
VDVVPPQRDRPARICPRTARESLTSTASGAGALARGGTPTRSKLLSLEKIPTPGYDLSSNSQ